MNEGLTNPVVFFQHYREQEAEDLQIKAAADMGVLMIDGLCDGLFLFNVLTASVADGLIRVMRAASFMTGLLDFCAADERLRYFGRYNLPAQFPAPPG